MIDQLSRIALLLGEEPVERLQKSHVAVFGVGGVGGFTVEALARSGVGEITIVDNDEVCLSNINRQIIATRSTVGRKKVDVMRERILDINPDIIVHVHSCFYLPETAGEFDFTEYDYVVDAVDTVTAKIELVMQAQAAGTPIISSMGAGNKLDPTLFQVSDIYKTSVCPLAKVMRRELKARHVKQLKVVYSTELAKKPIQDMNQATDEDINQATNQDGARKKAIPGSTAFVPSVAGLIIAGEVIKDLSGVR